MSDTLPEIREFLDQTGLPFEVWECDPSMADTEQFCRHYGVPAENAANTIVVKTRTGERKFAACVVLANSRLDVNHTVRKKLGVRKVSFASADETRVLTGMEIGGVTPLCLAGGIPVWIDSSVMKCEYVILGGGNRESKLKVSPEVFNHLATVEIVSGLASLTERS